MADTKDKKDRYIEGIGRRKASVARVRITPASKTIFSINEKTIEEYLPTSNLQRIATESLEKVTEKAGTYSVSVHVKGGGKSSQAESIRLGLARALVKKDEEFRKELKTSGYLKRDPRVKERKKFGLKKARKAAQWSKR